MAEDAYVTDPQADWYATEDEIATELVDLYRHVWTFADQTVTAGRLEAARPCSAVGSVMVR